MVPLRGWVRHVARFSLLTATTIRLSGLLTTRTSWRRVSSLTVVSVPAYFRASFLTLLSSFSFAWLHIFLIIILISCFVTSILSHSTTLYDNLPLQYSIHTLYIYLSLVFPTYL